MVLLSKAKSPARYIRNSFKGRSLASCDVLLTSDGAQWILDDMTRSLYVELNKAGVKSRVALLHQLKWTRLTGDKPLVHFIDHFAVFRFDALDLVKECTNVVGTWWHGQRSTPNPNIQIALDRAPEVARRLERIHVTCSISQRALIEECGIPENKIILVPMGIDLDRFRPPRTGKRDKARVKLGIPEGAVCIGSFQRDGDEQPKLEKGPDIFVKVIEKLYSRVPNIFVLLAGPKREYVKSNLRRMNVPFMHVGHIPSSDMCRFYHAVDLYLITSRDEGGPASVLEAMATGVPLVSTRVGMAADLIDNGRNGFLVDVEDVEGLAKETLAVIQNGALRHRVINDAYETIQQYDWKVLVNQYLGKVYGPLLNRGG